MSVLIVGVPTLAALWPARRSPLLASWSFRAGLLVNELPVVGWIFLALSTGLAASQGDLDSPGAWAMVALAAVVALGLAVLSWRSRSAAQVVEAALDSGLGSDRREVAGPMPFRRKPFAAIFLPLRRRIGDVERIANVEYGPDARNRLDVYRSRSGASGGPVLIHWHGGGYRGGRKDSQSLPMLYHLAAQGWVCVSANYRLLPAGHPAQLVDAKRVIAWARAHATEYGGDPATVITSGSSAGAHMASLAALTEGDAEFQPGFEDEDTSVAGVVCFGGYFGPFWHTGPESSPTARVGEAPPFLIVHGDNDTVVPVENARRFAGGLAERSSNPVAYTELPGAQHAFDLFGSRRFAAVIDGVAAFGSWAAKR